MSNVFNRPVCKEFLPSRIRAWVRQEAGLLGIASHIDDALLDQCVQEGALAATGLVRRRYLHAKRQFQTAVQEGLTDLQGPPEDTAASLARWAPGALHRLKARRA